MKKFSIGTLSMVTIYLASLFLFGEAKLSEQLISKPKSSFNEFRWTPEVRVVSNFETNHIKPLNNYFKRDTLNLLFQPIGSHNDLSEFNTHEDTYYYFIIHYGIFPITTVDEYENIEEYIATWEMKYVWIFYKWIKVQDISTGIS